MNNETNLIIRALQETREINALLLKRVEFLENRLSASGMLKESQQTHSRHVRFSSASTKEIRKHDYNINLSIRKLLAESGEPIPREELEAIAIANQKYEEANYKTPYNKTIVWETLNESKDYDGDLGGAGESEE